MTATWRATQKANRRAALIRSAAHLFAERGFAAVSTGELGEAVGMSGPALYKHFPSKDALLAEILVDVSERLLAGGQAIVAEDGPPAEVLERLVRFHLDFATSEPDVIRLQDRELPSLAPEANHRVRRLQREYVQSWDGPLARHRPDLDDDERQVRLMATFGLLNSTPHSAGGSARTPATHLPEGAHGADGARGSDAADRPGGGAGSDVIDVLAPMAWRALTG